VGGQGCKGSVKRTESIGSQGTRILRRGLEEGRGKDTSIYIAPRLGSAEPLTRVCNSAVIKAKLRRPRIMLIFLIKEGVRGRVLG